MRRAAPHQDVDSLPEKQVQSPNDGINSGRLKSIIVTPTDGRSEEQEEAREVVEIADDEETLLQFQSKKKKRSSNSIILRSPRLYPSILRGASSKKRKLSQIQHSPGNGKKRVDGETSKGSKTLAITKHGQLESEIEASRSLIQSDKEQHHIPHGKESVQEKKILSQENKIQRLNDQVQDLRRQLVQCRNENLVELMELVTELDQMPLSGV
ncbi:hypothetical protein YC2023_120658 [Brassica napus]